MRILHFFIMFFLILLNVGSQVAEYLVPRIRSIPANGSTKPTYLRFLTGIKAYSQIFSVSEKLKNSFVFVVNYFCDLNYEQQSNLVWVVINYIFTFHNYYAETCFWCKEKQTCAWRLNNIQHGMSISEFFENIILIVIKAHLCLFHQGYAEIFNVRVYNRENSTILLKM